MFLFVTLAQIDFRVAVTITGFVIRGFNQQWVKNFYIDYSTDQVWWQHHREPDESYQVCTTNNLNKNLIFLRTVPNFATAHSFCSSCEGLRNSGFSVNSGECQFLAMQEKQMLARDIGI